MKPSELLENNEHRFVACLGELPFTPVKPLSPIYEEGSGGTELVDSDTYEYMPDLCVFMADEGSGYNDNELLKEISTDEGTANAGVEDDTQKAQCR